MPILFAVVSRGDQILAKHAVCSGNFIEVTQQVLVKIPNKDDKLTYSHGKFLLHYISEGGIVYMCITDDAFERSRAFSFLNVIKRRFQQIYGQRALTAIPYAMNNDFAPVLASEMKAATFQRRTSTTSSTASGRPGNSDSNQETLTSSHESETSGVPVGAKAAAVRGQVEDLKKIMVKNIDTLANRGEKLELLIDRSQNLEHGAVNFRTHSRNLHNQMYWKNMKITVVICTIVAVIVVIIIWVASSNRNS